MKAILTFSLLFSLSAFSRSAREDQDVIVQEAFKKNMGQCQSFLESYCGSMKWEECAQKPDKKSEQVVQCVNFYVENQEKLKVEELKPNFQTLLQDFKGRASDQDQCIKTATVVCGEDVGFKECFQKQAGKFPSFCRDMARDNVDKMQAAYDNDAELQGCTNVLMNKCQKSLMRLGDEKVTSQKDMMASLSQYQACLKETLPKLKACEQLINVKKDKPLSPSVQRIYQK